VLSLIPIPPRASETRFPWLRLTVVPKKDQQPAKTPEIEIRQPADPDRFKNELLSARLTRQTQQMPET
jgi:hypothetical protein